MKANLPKLEPEWLERWAAMDIYGRIRQASASRPLWILHDGPPVRQRPHPHGDRAQQDPEGSGGEVALHARAQRGLRAGLGLPRAADRAPGGQGAGARPGLGRRAAGDGSAREAPALPRVREQVHRHPARGVPASRGLRRLARSVPHDGARLPGDHRARVRPLRGARPGAQGAQARALVHALQDRAGPGRGGVRGPDHALGLREVPPQGARAGPGRPRQSTGLARDLDHDAVDLARESRHRGPPRGDLHRGRAGRAGARSWPSRSWRHFSGCPA